MGSVTLETLRGGAGGVLGVAVDMTLNSAPLGASFLAETQSICCCSGILSLGS
jgi:hypothetical protein